MHSVKEKLEAGLVLIDKPKGPASSSIAVFVREILGVKCGHCGTLDPNVSGVLPLLTGKGIKLLEYLQKHDKEYVCIMQTSKPVAREKLEKVLLSFKGEIYQTPPLHSAVAKRVRVRKIYDIKLLEAEPHDKPTFFLFSMSCQHGTYVRKLLEDVGHILGVKIEMLELRRTQVSQWTEKDCVSLVKLKDAMELYKAGRPELLDKILLPLEDAIKNFPKVFIKPAAALSVNNGADVFAPGIERVQGVFEPDNPVIIMNADKMIGVGRAVISSKQVQEAKKGVVIDTEKVFKLN